MSIYFLKKIKFSDKYFLELNLSDFIGWMKEEFLPTITYGDVQKNFCLLLKKKD